MRNIEAAILSLESCLRCIEKRLAMVGVHFSVLRTARIANNVEHIPEPFNGGLSQGPFMDEKRLYRLPRANYSRCISVADWHMHINIHGASAAFFQYCCILWKRNIANDVSLVMDIYTRRSVKIIVIHLLVNYVTSWITRDILVLWKCARVCFYSLRAGFQCGAIL